MANMSNMGKNAAEALLAFLDKHRTAKGASYNVFGIAHHAGRYRVGDTRADEFWKLYCDAAAAGEALCLGEVPPHETVMRLDVDISQVAQTMLDEGDDRILSLSENLCYTDEQVATFVKLLHVSMAELIDDLPHEKIVCLMLEKSARVEVVDDGDKRISRIKKGFHLHWPHVVTETRAQRDWIAEVVRRVDAAQIFDLPKCPIDLASCEVPWLFYGSRKPDQVKNDSVIKHEPYVITRAFDFMGNLIDHESVCANIWLVDPRDDDAFIKNASINQKMTIRPWGRKVYSFRQIPRVIAKIPAIRPDKPSEPVDMEHVTALLGMLRIERCSEYSEWISVGRCLASITQGSMEGLAAWDEWSSQCTEKYCNFACQSKWASFSRFDITIGLLRSWAFKDNPTAYNEWKCETQCKLVGDLTRGTAGGIGKFAHDIIGNKFKYSHGKWYQYREPKWIPLGFKEEGTIPLQKELNGPIKSIFEEYKKKLLAAQDPDAEDDSKGASHVKFIERIICKLDDAASLRGIIEMLQIYYESTDFTDELDSDAFLIGVQNGIVDLKTGEFRAGKAEDMISKTLNCEYREYANDSIEMVEMHRYWEKVFPNQERREYMKDVLCQVFVGNMYLKNLFFWVGSGDNGKSVFARLFEEMLGTGYCVKLPTTLLSGAKGDAGRAAPELCQLRGKRLALFDEPDQSETLSNGTLKILTGRDSINPRDLFQRSKEMEPFVPLCQYVFVCNNEPDVKNSSDDALWERIRVCSFTSVFVKPEDAPETYEEQVEKGRFPKDTDFVNKIKRLTPVLCYFLLQHWRHTKGNVAELKTPSCVLQASAEYKNKNDLIKVFVAENMDPTAGSTIELANFKEKLFNYLSSKNFKIGMLSNYKLIEELRKLCIQVENGVIVNWQYKI